MMLAGEQGSEILLSISSTSADIVSAVTTAANIFALPGSRHEMEPAPKPYAKLIKSAGGGLITLTPDDIACDWPTSIPYEAPVKRFEHTPTITYRSGDKTVVITGPIEPTIPHMTESTRAGWEKWSSDRAAHIEAAIENSRQWAAN